MRDEIAEVMRLLEEKYNVRIYFYNSISNMNTFKGRYNIFINESLSTEKKMELIKKYLLIINENETEKVEKGLVELAK